MNTNPLFSKLQSVVAAVGLTVSLMPLANTANASGFQLFEESAVAVANFGAGVAAEAQDASTNFFNPAGLTQIKHMQIVAAGTGIILDSNVNATMEWLGVPGTTAGVLSAIAGGPYSETGRVQGAVPAFVPGFHLAIPLNDKWTFGFSTVVPFGLETKYDDESYVRYAGTQTRLINIDFAPSLAYAATDNVSFGAGLDIEYADVKFNSIGGLPVLNQINPNTPATANDTESLNQGYDWGFGWHAGVLIVFDPDTRVGFAYHSAVRFNLAGKSILTGPLARTANNGQNIISDNLTARVTLPDTLTASLYHKVDENFALVFTVFRTNWDVFKSIVLNNVASLNATGTAPAEIQVISPQNYKKTWRVAIGGNIQVRDWWLFRAAVGYDQTPINAVDRTIRLTGNDRVAVTLGSHFQVNKRVGIDVGYMHLFIKNSPLNNTGISGSQQVSVIGFATGSADLVSGQLTINLDKV